MLDEELKGVCFYLIVFFFCSLFKGKTELAKQVARYMHKDIKKVCDTQSYSTFTGLFFAFCCCELLSVYRVSSVWTCRSSRKNTRWELVFFNIVQYLKTVSHNFIIMLLHRNYFRWEQPSCLSAVYVWLWINSLYELIHDAEMKMNVVFCCCFLLVVVVWWWTHLISEYDSDYLCLIIFSSVYVFCGNSLGISAVSRNKYKTTKKNDKGPVCVYSDLIWKTLTGRLQEDFTRGDIIF